MATFSSMSTRDGGLRYPQHGLPLCGSGSMQVGITVRAGVWRSTAKPPFLQAKSYAAAPSGKLRMASRFALDDKKRMNLIELIDSKFGIERPQRVSRVRHNADRWTPFGKDI